MGGAHCSRNADEDDEGISISCTYDSTILTITVLLTAVNYYSCKLLSLTSFENKKEEEEEDEQERVLTMVNGEWEMVNGECMQKLL